MDDQPKYATLREIAGLILVALSVPVLFVGLTYLLEKVAEVIA